MTDNYRTIISNLIDNFSDLITALEKHQSDTNSRLAELECTVEKNRSTLRQIANTILERID